MSTAGAITFPLLKSALFTSAILIFGYKFFVLPEVLRRGRQRQEDLAEQVFQFSHPSQNSSQIAENISQNSGQTSPKTEHSSPNAAQESLTLPVTATQGTAQQGALLEAAKTMVAEASQS